MFLKKFKKDNSAENSNPAAESSKANQTDKKKTLNISKLADVMRQIISNKSSLALCTSYLAVGIATFASVTAVRNSHNNVFLESDENISRTVLSQDENAATSLDNKVLAELEARITQNVIESVTAAREKTDIAKDADSINQTAKSVLRTSRSLPWRYLRHLRKSVRRRFAEKLSIKKPNTPMLRTLYLITVISMAIHRLVS